MQNQETDIARFAKECDKIETLLQALIYSEENDENYLPEFLESYEDYFETPTGKEIFQQINQYSRDID
ncbi:hypothetical protein GLU60_02520 [Nanohaloarchaea archaeon H01]|nr:hypothetical protein [Nanohaloarchaea archaeon H01]